MVEAGITDGSPDARGLARAAAVEASGTGSLVRLRGRAIGRATRWYPVPPDVAKARRWIWTLRRVDLVEITVRGGRHHCQVSGIGYRRPVSHTVSLATALGLGALGLPLTVDQRD